MNIADRINTIVATGALSRKKLAHVHENMAIKHTATDTTNICPKLRTTKNAMAPGVISQPACLCLRRIKRVEQ